MANRARRATWCVLIAAFLRAGAAGATHPDYEGERGPELTLMPGFGGYLTSDESVFRTAQFLPRPEDGPPPDAFSGGFAFNVAAGYRFAPYVSAGLEGGYQSASSANVYSTTDAMYEPSDRLRAFHLGAYGRLYPMAFFNGSRNNPRVFFESWSDRRRFEPWASLGLSFNSVNRRRTFADVRSSDSYESITTNYLGIPIGVGLDYRLIPRLAVGVAFNLTPVVAGGTSYERYDHMVGTSNDPPPVMTTTSYAPLSSSNATFFVGLAARYTFTYW